MKFIQYDKFMIGKVLILLFALIFMACKKEQQASPYSNIVNFTVKDAKGAVLKAGIENNELLLYWPPEQAVPDFISPTITVAAGAEISPASGTQVPFKDGTTYTVRAKNGSTTTYKIKLKINSLIPYVRAVNFTVYKGRTFLSKGSSVTILGDYFSSDVSLVKVFLLAKDGKEAEVKVEKTDPISISFIADGPLGEYERLKVISNNRSVTYEQKFELAPAISFPTLSPVSFEQPQTWKRGDQVNIKGGSDADLASVIGFYDINAGTEYPLTIKEKRKDGWILQIPSDLPLGVYTHLYFYFPDTDYSDGGAALVDFPAPVTIVP